MRSGELYFLIFACGVFGILSVGLIVNLIHDWRWRRKSSAAGR